MSKYPISIKTELINLRNWVFVCGHRSKALELLELLLLLLFFSISLISCLKEIKVKKILPDGESNRVPLAHQQSTLSMSYRHVVTFARENYLFNLRISMTSRQSWF